LPLLLPAAAANARHIASRVKRAGFEISKTEVASRQLRRLCSQLRSCFSGRFIPYAADELATRWHFGKAAMESIGRNLELSRDASRTSLAMWRRNETVLFFAE